MVGTEDQDKFRIFQGYRIGGFRKSKRSSKQKEA
jgi:hypothetical protein